MKIEQSSVALNSQHVFASTCEFRIESESRFRTIFDGLAQAGEVAASADSTNSINSTGEERRRQVLLTLERLLARLLECISGGQASSLTDLREVLPAAETARAQGRTVLEWTSESIETIREHESTAFASTGTIRTADGQRLDFTLELEMCRDFSCERRQTERATVALCDPLVINFDGRATELSGKRFVFDLNADGTSEAIHDLGRGSGYLAIDRNGDGCINDGSELFGTQSGNGFADLAGFDDDRNGWLDENDSVFDRLRIWQRDAEVQEGGNASAERSVQDSLSTLRERDIGALYLGSVETPFALTDDENRLLGQIRASGVYLREDGRAGSLQQVDLAV